jgi:hypothetical protein
MTWTHRKRSTTRGSLPPGVDSRPTSACTAKISGLARGAELPSDVMILQRTAGNRAVARLLQRAPSGVKGGVETTEVSPEVARLLAAKKIPYAREVTFEVLDATGRPVLRGRMDYFFRDPRTGDPIIAEIKGLDLEALTPSQKQYVPMFEKGSATIRITSRKGGALKLPAGSIERVSWRNFVRIGRGNLKDFADALEQVTTGERVKYSIRDEQGLRFFKTDEEFEAALAQKGMTRTGAVPAKGPAKAPASRPLKPPAAKAPAPEPAKPSAPTTEGARPTEPAAHPSEPAAHPSKPGPRGPKKPSKGGGGIGGVVGVIVPWVLGEIHQRAQASHVAERAKDKGYVPEGDRGWLDKLGDILFDPTGEGERNVPITARVNMAKWRQTARGLFSGHKPGDTVVYRWDYYRSSRPMYSRYFVYLLGVNGKWFIITEGTSLEGAHNFSDRESPDSMSPQARDFFSTHPNPYHVTPWDEVPPDINDVISPTVPDTAVQSQMTIDETIA